MNSIRNNFLLFQSLSYFLPVFGVHGTENIVLLLLDSFKFVKFLQKLIEDNNNQRWVLKYGLVFQEFLIFNETYIISRLYAHLYIIVFSLLLRNIIVQFRLLLELVLPIHLLITLKSSSFLIK